MPYSCISLHVTEHSEFHPLLSVLISSTLLVSSSFCIVLNPKFEA